MSELLALPLSAPEVTRLYELEVVVERGLATFVEVGQALMEIRESRLYREDNATFEDYCRERWQMSKTHANRLVDASEVAGALAPIGVNPANEAQVRELAPLLRAQGPAAAAEAWQEVRENGVPTAEKVREVVARRMDVHYSSDTPEWETPFDLFTALDHEFRFDLDVCATADNTKCATFYSREEDGLAQPWLGACWMNPPYGREISAWVKKAWESAQASATVVCLVPARVDTEWWWDYCRHGEVRFLKGRLRFGGGDMGAPFPSAVVVFPREPRVVWWERDAA